jgi:hypothetical protein
VQCSSVNPGKDVQDYYISAEQKRLVFCGRPDDEEMDEKYCEAVLKPKSSRECTNKRCKGKWKEGEWSEVRSRHSKS